MATGKICRIQGCKNVLKFNDGQVCSMHRSRYHRHGSYDISPNWPNLQKGKPHYTNYGYLRVSVNGKRVLQHRYIMEKHLGRKLKKGEVVHHKNGIKDDNRIENLEIISDNGKHMRNYHPRKPNIDWDNLDIKVPKKKYSRWHPSKTTQCIFNGCDDLVYCKDLCVDHYHSYNRYYS